MLFILPAESLMAEDRVLQVSERLQASSSNCDTKRFHFSAIVHYQNIEKIDQLSVCVTTCQLVAV